MKLIKHSENRYYIQSEREALAVKYSLHGSGKTLGDLADFLKIQPTTLYRKLSFKEDYKHFYFLEDEFNKLMDYTGLIFDIE